MTRVRNPCRFDRRQQRQPLARVQNKVVSCLQDDYSTGVHRLSFMQYFDETEAGQLVYCQNTVVLRYRNACPFKPFDGALIA